MTYMQQEVVHCEFSPHFLLVIRSLGFRWRAPRCFVSKSTAQGMEVKGASEDNLH